MSSDMDTVEVDWDVYEVLMEHNKLIKAFYRAGVMDWEHYEEALKFAEELPNDNVKP